MKQKQLESNREVTQMLGIPLRSLDTATYTSPRRIGNEDSARHTNRSDEALGMNASVRLQKLMSIFMDPFTIGFNLIFLTQKSH